MRTNSVESGTQTQKQKQKNPNPNKTADLVFVRVVDCVSVKLNESGGSSSSSRRRGVAK